MILTFIFTLIGFALGRLSKPKSAHVKSMEIRNKQLCDSIYYYQKVLDEKDICIKQLRAESQTVKSV